MFTCRFVSIRVRCCTAEHQILKIICVLYVRKAYKLEPINKDTLFPWFPWRSWAPIILEFCLCNVSLNGKSSFLERLLAIDYPATHKSTTFAYQNTWRGLMYEEIFQPEAHPFYTSLTSPMPPEATSFVPEWESGYTALDTAQLLSPLDNAGAPCPSRSSTTLAAWETVSVTANIQNRDTTSTGH